MIRAWHFIKNNYRTGEGNIEVFEGQTLEVDPPIKLCSWGLHASVQLIDALCYAPGNILCLVELDGQILEGTDKCCATKRTVIKIMDATRLLQEFSLFCAEQAIDICKQRNIEVDPRTIQAADVLRLWLGGNATLDQINAAVVAAYAARAAAYDAARAYAAARAADVAKKEQAVWLENKAKELFGV